MRALHLSGTVVVLALGLVVVQARLGAVTVILPTWDPTAATT